MYTVVGRRMHASFAAWAVGCMRWLVPRSKSQEAMLPVPGGGSTISESPPRGGLHFSCKVILRSLFAQLPRVAWALDVEVDHVGLQICKSATTICAQVPLDLKQQRAARTSRSKVATCVAISSHVASISKWRHGGCAIGCTNPAIIPTRQGFHYSSSRRCTTIPLLAYYIVLMLCGARLLRDGR
jgi:hypothetical protein